MSGDNVDLREIQEEKRVRAKAMSAGIVMALLAICFVIGVTLWYDGWLSRELGVATAPSNPSAGESPAPAAPPATVGQSAQDRAPVQPGQ